MKKYENIITKVRAYEEKRGISYAKSTGTLFQALKKIYILLFAYTMLWNLLYILSILMNRSNSGSFNGYGMPFTVVCVSTAVLTSGFVIMFTKIKLAGIIANIFPIVSLGIVYAQSTKDIMGFLGFKLIFYWRHAVPLLLMLIICIIMIVIIIRENVIFNSNYKKIVENLYNEYHNDIDNGESENENDGKWDEFLKNYDISKLQ